MRIMIHTCVQREWYVYGYLLSEIYAQGASPHEIEVYIDTEKKGNLQSCLESFTKCSKNDAGGTWHLQDDVILASDAVQRMREHDDGLVAGFVNQKWGPDPTAIGRVPIDKMWYSFQCLRIPDIYAGAFAKWVNEDAYKRDRFFRMWRSNKHDDEFFRYWLLEVHPEETALNLKPCLVDHIDYLIGGTVVNPYRSEPINRAAYWADESLVKKLEAALKEDGTV